MVFGGDWPWPSNLISKSKFTPFWACPHDNSSPVQSRATKFRPKVLNTLVKIPVVCGVDWAWHINFNLFSKSCLFASLLRLWNICETCKKRMKRSLFHIPSPRLGDWQWIFACFCRLTTNHTYLTCWNFVCQHSVMAETTVKWRAFAFIAIHFQSIGLSRFVYVGAIFSAVNTRRGFHLTVIAWRRSWHCCI